MKLLGRMLLPAAMVAAGLGWMATTASAVVPLIDKGTKEFSVGASLESASDTTTTTINGTSGTSGATTSTTENVNGAFGYFLGRHAQIGGYVDYMNTYSSPPTGTSTTITTAYYEGFYKFHFRFENTPQLVPYVGAYAGLSTLNLSSGGVSITGTGFSFAAAGGVKYFLNERMSMNVEGQYGAASYSISNSAAAANVSLTQNRTSGTLLFSLSVYFGG